MKIEKSNPNATLIELLSGILLFEIVCELIGVFLVKDTLKYSAGLFIGAILACASAIHMYWSLRCNFEMNGNNEKGAQSYAIRNNMIRNIFIFAVFLVVCMTDFVYPLATFLGIMGLKAGAYLQPLTYKLIFKIKRKKIIRR